MIKPKATFRQISESLLRLLALCVSLVFGLAAQADPMTYDSRAMVDWSLESKA
jgi:hypothetical protein